MNASEGVEQKVAVLSYLHHLFDSATHHRFLMQLSYFLRSITQKQPIPNPIDLPCKLLRNGYFLNQVK